MKLPLFLAPLLFLAWVPSTPPAEPPPPDDIAELTTFSDLAEVFNRDQGTVRLVALLSPSCGYCIKGYRYMRKILDEVDDERLRMYVVWEPMLSGDSKKLAARMSRKTDDPRMAYQAWDAERVTGETWKEALGLEGVAWDVYFLYDTDASWPYDVPTDPDYWQHQGASRQADWLDYDKLKAQIEAALGRTG